MKTVLMANSACPGQIDPAGFGSTLFAKIFRMVTKHDDEEPGSSV